MLNNVALDVFIGLIFIYLLYSLLTTIIQEIVVRMLSLRARMQTKAIARMLDDEHTKKLGLQLLNIVVDLGYNLFFFFFGSTRARRPFTKLFYAHPTIKYLGESAWTSKPSYLKCETFSSVLIDILRTDAYDGSQNQMDLIKDTLRNKTTILEKEQMPISQETLRQLRMLLNESAGDLEKFKTSIETWFNETMDRCSGWFKTQNQIISFIIGLFIAINFNIDSIVIARILSTDKNAREQMVQLAVAAKDQGDSTYLNQSYKEVKASAEAANLVLGLSDDKLTSIRKNLKYKYDEWIPGIGFLITALAITLGAPFWFDLLNKIMQFRASGKSKEEKGEPGEAKTNVSNVPPHSRVG